MLTANKQTNKLQSSRAGVLKLFHVATHQNKISKSIELDYILKWQPLTVLK